MQIPALLKQLFSSEVVFLTGGGCGGGGIRCSDVFVDRVAYNDDSFAVLVEVGPHHRRVDLRDDFSEGHRQRAAAVNQIVQELELAERCPHVEAHLFVFTVTQTGFSTSSWTLQINRGVSWVRKFPFQMAVKHFVHLF